MKVEKNITVTFENEEIRLLQEMAAHYRTWSRNKTGCSNNEYNTNRLASKIHDIDV